MASNNEQFYKRLATLSGIVPVNESKNETNTKTLISFERADNGTAYGIVKENHNYFIKKALIKEGDVNVTDFTYIDGVENKGHYQYGSISEAEKQRNFYLRGINEAWSQGGVYFVNETNETETPSLDTKEDFSSLVKRTISEGKKNIVQSREKKFKATLPENVENGAGARIGLMPEAADLAVKKALGLVNEEAMVTADSEIKDADKVSEKKSKESPQAPINDSNAKAKAEKATGKSKKDANKKPEASDSLAVNQADKVLKEEVSPLVTDDSEINAADSVADKVNQKHESPQAPINDSNAKAEADKATGSGSASAAISNNVDDSPESEPFDDKENAGDENGDIVTESHDHKDGEPFKENPKGEKDIVTKDSDQTDGDRIDNETKVEKEQADYNNHNQPEKGHKDEKGEQLKDTAKEVVIGEAESLIVKDSEIKAADALADMTKTNLPKKTGKSEIVADSDMNPKETLANKTTTNLPDAIAEGVDDDDDDAAELADIESAAGGAKAAAVADMSEADAKEQPESDPFDDKENAGDEKGDIVAEAESLIVKDSKIDPSHSLANQDKGGNIDYNVGKLVQGTSLAMNDNAIAEADEAGEEIDAAASALDGLDIATDAEEAAPEMSGAEEPVDTEMGAEMGAELGDEVPDAAGEEAAEGDAENLAVQEIEKLVGKMTEKIRTTELEPETAEGFLKSVVTSFKDKLPEIDLDAREEVAKDIKNPDQMGGHTDGDVAMDAEVAPEGGDVAMDGVEEPAMDGVEVPAEEPVMDVGMEEDAPVEINGEPKLDDAIPDGEGSESTFEAYMESRGYNSDNMDECSVNEMGSIMAGYATENGENLGEADYQEVGKYMNDEVVNELAEYGHSDFADKVKPFMEEGGISFGMTEPTLPALEMEVDEDGVAEPEVDLGSKQTKNIMTFEGGEEEGGEEGIEAAIDGAIDGAEEVPVVDDEPVVAIGEPADEPVDVAPAMGFATDSQVLGAGMPRPDGAGTKTVEVDINAGTVKLQVEGEDKVRKYVKEKLEELAGKKKMNINESKKSDNLKKLDKLIEQQWKMLGESVKKK